MNPDYISIYHTVLSIDTTQLTSSYHGVFSGSESDPMRITSNVLPSRPNLVTSGSKSKDGDDHNAKL